VNTNKFIHITYSILGGGTFLLMSMLPSFAGSLPSCLRVINRDVNHITVRNDCNKTVQYYVVSPIALTICQSIRPREVQTTRLPKILGIKSC
jgi:hypothetical protein